MTHILLVEDDIKLANLISEYLHAFEFQVTIETRGDNALSTFNASEFDLVILDLMLPGLDGMSICQEIRKNSLVPILILTAKEELSDEITGLESGADDYLNKPVQPRVLLARVRALLRRSTVTETIVQDDLVFGELTLSAQNHIVLWKGEPIELTHSEYKLLSLLAIHAGQVLSRDVLFKKIRGIEFDGFDRSIDNSISRLRRRFDDEKGAKIKTIWGEGYQFCPMEW